MIWGKFIENIKKVLKHFVKKTIGHCEINNYPLNQSDNKKFQKQIQKVTTDYLKGKEIFTICFQKQTNSPRKLCSLSRKPDCSFAQLTFDVKIQLISFQSEPVYHV